MKTTKYGIIWSQNAHFVITGASNQKTSLTKVVKEYVLIHEMSLIPINMESFRHKLFISSQPY